MLRPYLPPQDFPGMICVSRKYDTDPSQQSDHFSFGYMSAHDEVSGI